MKLFSTFLMSLALSASAYAGVQSQGLRTPANSGIDHRVMSQYVREQLHQGQRLAMPHATTRTSQPRMAQAAAASDEVLEFHYDWYSMEWECRWPEWFCSVEDDEYLFMLDIFCEDEDSPAGEYTSDNDDFNLDFCYGMNYETGDFIFFDQMTATITQNGPVISFDALGVSTDGVTYHLVCQPPLPLDPKSEVSIDGDITSFVANPGASVITLVGGDKTFTLAYPGVVGTFEEFGSETGYTDAAGNFVGLDHGKLSVSIGQDDVAKLNASLVCADTIQYNLTGQTTIVPVGEQSIVCHDLAVSDVMGFIYVFDGTNEEGYSVKAIMSQTPSEGDFTQAMTLLIKTPENPSGINGLYNKSVTLSLDENGSYMLEAETIGMDYVRYLIEMDFELPAITETRDFISDKGELDDFIDKMGVIQLLVNGKDWFSLVLEVDDITSGHYTQMSSAYKSFCSITTDQRDVDALVNYQMYSIDFDFQIDEERNYTLKGQCQAGAVLWNVDIKGHFYQEGEGGLREDMREDVNEMFTADDLLDVEDADGSAFLKVQEGKRYFPLMLYYDGEANEMLPAGVYTFSDSQEPGTAQAGEYDSFMGTVSATFYGILNAKGEVVGLFLCKEGTVTVSFDEEGELVFVVDATNTWGQKAHIEFNTGGTGIGSVANDGKAVLDGKFLEDNRFIIRSNGRLYNAFGQRVAE